MKLFVLGLIIMVVPCFLGWLLPPIVIFGLVFAGFLWCAVTLWVFFMGPPRGGNAEREEQSHRRPPSKQ